jgi:hypothetical protein
MDIKGEERVYTYIKKIVFRLIDGTLMEVTGEEATHLYNFVLGDEDIAYIEFEVGEARRMVPRDAIVYFDVMEHVEANELAEKMNDQYITICTLGHIKKDSYRWTYWFIDNNELFAESGIHLSSDIGVVKQAELLLYRQRKMDELLSPVEQKEIV